jgi:hypothetical protein
MANRVRNYFEDFLGKRSWATGTAEAGSGLMCTIVKTSGAPTVATISDKSGTVKILTDNTSEVQQVSFYQGDVLPFDLRGLQKVKFRFKVGGPTSATTCYLGIAGAYNATASSITNCALLKVANLAVSPLIYTGSAQSATASGKSIVADTWYDGEIDFTGGVSNVRFYMSDSNGQMQRLLSATTFDMSGISTGTNVQLFFRTEKTSGTDVPILYLDNVDVDYKVS